MMSCTTRRVQLVVLALLLLVVLCSDGIAQHDGYAEAFDLYSQREFGAAKSAIDRAIQKEPEKAESYYLKALILLGQGDLESASPALTKCLSLKPSHDRAILTLGQVYARQKNYPKAIELLQLGLKYDPENYQANYQLGAIYAGLEQYENARSVLSRIEDQGKEKFEFNYTYGLVLNHLRKFRDAIEHLQRALDARAGHVPTVISLAHCYEGLGDLEPALHTIQDVLAKNPKKINALKVLGDIQLSLSRFDGAVSTGDTMIRIAPRQTWGYLLRAKAHQALGQSQKAIADFKKAVELKGPGTHLAAARLASMYYQRRQYLEAEYYYRDLYQSQKEVTPLLMLAHCYYKQGRHDKALETYKKVLKMSPGSDDALQGAKSSQEHIDRKNKRKKAK